MRASLGRYATADEATTDSTPNIRPIPVAITIVEPAILTGSKSVTATAFPHKDTVGDDEYCGK